MSSESSLYVAGIFLSYTLQLAAAYLVCRLVARLLSRPQYRFALWMVFLFAAGTYWMSLAYGTIRSFSAHEIVSGTSQASFSPLTSGFIVPPGWSHAILLCCEALGLVYVSVLVCLLGMMVWRHLRVGFIIRRGAPAPDDLVRLLDDARCDLGAGRCDLLVLSNLASPATAGCLRPRILLPAVCADIGPTPQLSDALYHELAHVGRRDYLWAGLSDFICRLLFFHPVVWLARKSMRLEGELACDLAVIEARPEHNADYAGSLAYFARLSMLQEQASLGIDFAASASSLGRRIRYILDGPQPLSWWKRVSRAMIGLAIISLFAVVAPALTIVLDFGHPAPIVIKPDESGASSSGARRRAHVTNHRQEMPAQDLTQAHMFIPETPVYPMISSRGSGVEQTEQTARPPWVESTPSVRQPSITDVLRSTVGAIVLGRDGDRDRGHDRDRHLVSQ